MWSRTSQEQKDVPYDFIYLKVQTGKSNPGYQRGGQRQWLLLERSSPALGVLGDEAVGGLLLTLLRLLFWERHLGGIAVRNAWGRVHLTACVF